MSAYVMCLNSSAGMPLFVRKKGHKNVMSYSKMASLNGVHLFLKTHNIQLLNTDIIDTMIVWKEFKGSIILIAIANGTKKCVIDNFLDAVFSAMVLTVGLKDIKNPRSIERLKRDLRACYSIIDRLLECLDVGDRTRANTDLIHLTGCVISSDNHFLQMSLQGYLEYLDSVYGCILIHDCLAVATESWWALEPLERNLIVLIITLENIWSSKDLTIFLPNKSPNLAHRLVSIVVVNNIKVLALCGPIPELVEIENLGKQYWRNSVEVLRTIEQCHPRNIPSTISLDSGILGFLLINYNIGKFVLSINTQNLKSHISGTHRSDIVRSFYHHAVEIFLFSNDLNIDEEASNHKSGDKCKGVRETYWCSEYHRCHALKHMNHIICILFTSIVPTYTMRLITQKTLKFFLSDKQICW